MKFLFVSTWIVAPFFVWAASSPTTTTTSAFTPIPFPFLPHQVGRSRRTTPPTGSPHLFSGTSLSSSSSDSSTSSSSSSLTSDEQRAKDVFVQFDKNDSGTISSDELTDMLRTLDIEASAEDANALLSYLDTDGDGVISLLEFLPWYRTAVDSARQVAEQFQNILIGRRTVDYFDDTPVSDTVLERAIQCAISAPNRSQSEPWRFIKLGPETVQQIAALKMKRKQAAAKEAAAVTTTATTTVTTVAAAAAAMETDNGVTSSSSLDWTKIPGWCVVTTKLSSSSSSSGSSSSNESAEQIMAREMEDFKSTSCAVQNFMLSMWSEGIGTKWTSGPVQKTQEFADLCQVDTTKERVIGCIWYGFATGGLINADPKRRKNSVQDVLSRLP